MHKNVICENKTWYEHGSPFDLRGIYTFSFIFQDVFFHKQTNLNVETFLSEGAGEIFTDKGEAGELLRVVKLSRNCP